MRNEVGPKLSQRSLFLLHCSGAPLLSIANLALILYECLRSVKTRCSRMLTWNVNLQAELHNSSTVLYFFQVEDVFHQRSSIRRKHRGWNYRLKNFIGTAHARYLGSQFSDIS